MGRQANQAKAIEWQERLRRFEECALTVARFCARERVTVPTFWYWRRKCADIGDPPEPSPPAFTPVDVIGGRPAPLRFPAGAVLEIPEDRPDLVRIAIEALSGAPQPCCWIAPGFRVVPPHGCLCPHGSPWRQPGDGPG
jgi:hypothetical protein